MKKLFTFLILILAAACEKEVIVEVPDQQAKLVVNGIIRTQANFRVTVGKTADVLDFNNASGYRVTNALVQLFENNVLRDTLVYDSASAGYNVKRNMRPVAGRTYLLKVSAPGFGPVESVTKAPRSTPIESLTRLTNVRKDAAGNFMDEIKLTFTDEATLGNHYFFRVRRARYQGGNSVIYAGIECMRSPDRDIEGRSSGDPLHFETCIDREFYMRDINFNGKKKELVLYIDHNALEPVYVQSLNQHYKPIIELHTITADHYKYNKSIGAYRDAEDNPFAEPVLVYSNVKNGYGIFTTFDVARDSIR